MSDQRPSVIVTGGGRGIGLAIASRLGARGYRVGVLARTADQVARSAASIRESGGEAIDLVADVRHLEAVSRAFDRFRSWAGSIDGLVSAAGTLRAVGPLESIDPAVWWVDVETALRGTSLCLHAALSDLGRSELATFVALVGPGHNGDLPHASAYASAQAALARLVETLATETLPRGVACYAVNPGLVFTGITRALVESETGRRWLPRFNDALAEGKEVGAEVVADTVEWLFRTRPRQLRGRVVSALLPPEIQETRLDRVEAENLGVLRLR